MLNDIVVHQESFRYIQLNFQEIMSTQNDDFTNLAFEIPKSLLLTKNLRVDTEKSASLAIEAWVEERKSERKRHVSLLLACLALEDLDENLAKVIMKYDQIVNKSQVLRKTHQTEITVVLKVLS